MKQYKNYLSSRNRRSKATIMNNIGGRWLQWKEKYTQNTITEQKW